MATLYVRKSGSDSNAGTSAGAAKLTIASAYAAASAGDTIYVGSGVYRETASLTIAKANLSIIGDYSGAQTGDAGPVRWHNSAADVSYVAGNQAVHIQATGVTLRFLAISCQAASYAVYLSGSVSAANCTIQDCVFDGHGYLIQHTYASALATGLLVERCLFNGAAAGGIWYYQGDQTDRTLSWTVRNCVFVQGNNGIGVRSDHGGGVAVSNCTFVGGVPVSVNGTGTMSTACTMTYCLVDAGAWWAIAQTAGFLTEDYNVFALNSGYSALSNVTAGSNSITRAFYYDPRPWFAAVSGGTLATPWDIGPDWQGINHVVGSGGYATDARGATVKGAYREVGALEYNSALTAAGSSSSPSVLRSPVIKGAH